MKGGSTQLVERPFTRQLDLAIKRIRPRLVRFVQQITPAVIAVNRPAGQKHRVPAPTPFRRFEQTARAFDIGGFEGFRIVALAAPEPARLMQQCAMDQRIGFGKVWFSIRQIEGMERGREAVDRPAAKRCYRVALSDQPR